MSADGPLARQTLCVGAGTTVTIRASDGSVGLHLTGFATGASCHTPVDGTLDGCWD